MEHALVLVFFISPSSANHLSFNHSWILVSILIPPLEDLQSLFCYVPVYLSTPRAEDMTVWYKSLLACILADQITHEQWTHE